MVELSLILCTFDRSEEVRVFLQKALFYTYNKFEVIICDQNLDNRIENILSDFIKNYNPKFKIKHIKTRKGLSRSRNDGIRLAEGNIISIPDDDSYFEKHALENIIRKFNYMLDVDIILAKWMNPDINGFQPQKTIKDGVIQNPLLFFSMMSSQIFFRKKIIEIIGDFDENLGLGSSNFFEGSEDFDFLLRSYNKSLKIYYAENIIMFHPWKGIENKKDKIQRKEHFSRIRKAGASDYYVFIKNFTFKKRIRLWLGNTFHLFLNLFLFKKNEFLNHYNRILGFIHAICILKKI